MQHEEHQYVTSEAKKSQEASTMMGGHQIPQLHSSVELVLEDLKAAGTRSQK